MTLAPLARDLPALADPRLGVRRVHDRGGATLAAEGELVVGTLPRFLIGARDLLRSGAGVVVFDFCDVTYVDDIAVACVLNLTSRAERRGVQVRVRGRPGPVLDRFGRLCAVDAAPHLL